VTTTPNTTPLKPEKAKIAALGRMESTIPQWFTGLPVGSPSPGRALLKSLKSAMPITDRDKYPGDMDFRVRRR
jgi:hypothetical protein